MADWTPDDLRAWRSRLRWTQVQAAAALCFHVEAYKKLECGTRAIVPRIRRLCILTEREHVWSLYSTSRSPNGRQAFSTPERVLGRMEALSRDASWSAGTVARACATCPCSRAWRAPRPRWSA